MGRLAMPDLVQLYPWDLQWLNGFSVGFRPSWLWEPAKFDRINEPGQRTPHSALAARQLPSQ